MQNFLKFFLSILMLERFSYYSIRISLVMLLKDHYKFLDSDIYAIYSVFVALGYFIPILSGVIADKYLGYKQSIALGIVFVTAGMVSSLFSLYDIWYFYFSLSLISVGVAAFRGSLNNLLSLCYEKNNENSMNGFTLLHIGANIGAVFASISVGMFYDYYSIFIISLLAMLLSVIIFIWKGNIVDIENIDVNIYSWALILLGATASSLGMTYLFYDLNQFTYYLSYGLWLGLGAFIFKLFLYEGQERKNMLAAFSILMLSVFFFMIQMQKASFIALFIKRCVNNNVFGYDIPVSLAQAINPLIVILIGFAVVKWGNAKNRLMKFSVSLSSVALMFIILLFGINFAINFKVHYVYLFASLAILAIGEVFIAPFLNASVTKLSPEKEKGFMMGIVMLTMAFSNLLGAYFSKIISIDINLSASQTLSFYAEAFKAIVWYNIIYFIVALPIIYFISRVFKE